MITDIPNIRPAFLSSETYSLLNNLREFRHFFRHFFRHAYGETIEYEQLKGNLEKSLKLLVRFNDRSQTIYT